MWFKFLFMVKKILVSLLFFTVVLFETNAQNYPQNYFRYPLDSLTNLVSPFGGLRDNHFHSGMDLRTNQQEGLPVFASADGYISRIKIQSIGYGKAIYIDHPNGYTTVYGHLQKYSGKIAQWIHNYQYKNQTFEFDYVFEKPILLVKKGDTIGLSGNSGGSSGPHVHFEIRNTKSEKIINPTLFGIIPFDTINPTIKKVFIYKNVNDGLLLKKELKIDQTHISKLKEFTNVFIYNKQTELEEDQYGFGIETYDYIHNLEEEKGIYEYSLKHKGKLVFKHTLNQFAFNESKFINAHIDFPFYKTEKVRIQKCFIDDGNEFSTYETNIEKGKIYLTEKSIDTLIFEVIDNNKNFFVLYLPIKVLNKKTEGIETYQLDLNGSYQAKNVQGVLGAIGILQTKGWPISNQHIHDGLSHVKKNTGLYGRWQMIGTNPTTVVDVAHNVAGIQTLLSQIKLVNHQQLHIVFGMVKDKDIDSVLALLPTQATYYFTPVSYTHLTLPTNREV